MSKGHIRRRGASSWELKYDVERDGGGRRTVYRSFKGSKRQAQTELARLLTQAAQGTHVDPTSSASKNIYAPALNTGKSPRRSRR